MTRCICIIMFGVNMEKNGARWDSLLKHNLICMPMFLWRLTFHKQHALINSEGKLSNLTQSLLLIKNSQLPLLSVRLRCLKSICFNVCFFIKLSTCVRFVCLSRSLCVCVCVWIDVCVCIYRYWYLLNVALCPNVLQHKESHPVDRLKSFHHFAVILNSLHISDY